MSTETNWDYDSGAGLERVSLAFERHGVDAVLADPSLGVFNLAAARQKVLDRRTMLHLNPHRASVEPLLDELDAAHDQIEALEAGIARLGERIADLAEASRG